MIYPNLFKNNYPSLKGRDWLRTIQPEDKKFFVELGMKHSEYGRLGGLSRAKNGKRDKKGKFTK